MLKLLVPCCLSLSQNQQLFVKFSKLYIMAHKKVIDFGYGFNKDGQLRKLDSETGLPGSDSFEFMISTDHNKNQKNYEALGEAVTEYIYEMLEKECLLEKLYVPNNINNEEKSFIYASKGALSNKDKLLILIHGSGVVRAGQWARSLIINDCLRTGTQFEYIKKAVELGYGVIVTNTNDNYRLNGQKKIAIAGSNTPEEHMESVWHTYICNAQAKYLFIVAHSYGGVVTLDFVNKQFTDIHNKLIAVAFTDSVHSMLTVKDPKIKGYLQKVAKNWVTSQHSLDTPEKTSATDIARVSAGHMKHEMTSSSCIHSVFAYFDACYLSSIKVD